MLKKTVTYTDYFGHERTEDFYFNFSKAEVVELENTTAPDGKTLSEYLSQIVEARNIKELVIIFKDLVLKAYGERSEDGRRFIKNEEIRQAFSETEAYSEIFYECATNADAAADFINGVLPNIEPVN